MAFKVIRFLDGPPGLDSDLRAAWLNALGASPPEPVTGRPDRVTLARPLADPGGGRPAFAAVDLQWFADRDEAAVNEQWLSGAGPDLDPAGSGFGPRSRVVIAEEVIGRGADYLHRRWLTGGTRFKMMSFGRRNPRLTPAEFSTRWRAEAGNVGSQTIPTPLQGLAYVQNHPVARTTGEWPLDAINEVYFEQLDDLRHRAEWLAARLETARGSGADGLMSLDESGSLLVEEEVLTDQITSES